jgi:phenylalanyl-tRNA synthetase beta chain
VQVPLSWLKDYVDIPVSVRELAERLTLAGLEVETIDSIGLPGAELPWDPHKIVVGEIRAVHAHPNADRLVLAEVEYGGLESETVVSGPPSLLPLRGQGDLHLKAAFAQEGALLWDAYAEVPRIKPLKPSKIRGVLSRAMVCSEKELGLSDEHEDIIYLPDDAPVGTPLADYLGDAVLSFDIKGPFGHVQSVFGIAREVAALFGTSVRRDVIDVLDQHPARLDAAPDFLVLEIPAPDLCPRYTAALIQGIKVGPSPFWMQMRLRRAGMRPINNIVDITNYVMLELGQPLHAFDYRVLRPKPGQKVPAIIVRRAHSGETMATLDGVMRSFDQEMLLITDGQGPVAVAGVMGGLDSEIREDTTDILLESANFHFLSVRRTSRLLGLDTDASKRFGRQVDPELPPKAAARAAYLMAELAGGTVAPVLGDLYPGRQPAREIQFDPAFATRLLGAAIPRADMVRILSSLEFQVSDAEGDTLSVTVPSYRLDVSRPVDLVEEVGRVWGYDRFPPTLMCDELPPQRDNPRLRSAEKVRDLLTGCALDEVITYSLVQVEEEAKLRPADPPPDPAGYLHLRNPLTAARSTLRKTLLPGMLDTARRNLRFLERVPIFEIGAVYLPAAGQELPNEPRRLGIVMTGPREEGSWLAGQDRQMMGFFELKGVVEVLVRGLGVTASLEPTEHPSFHPGRCAQLSVDGKSVGVMGELHPLVREKFDLPDQPVAALECDLDLLLAGWGAAHPVQAISPHPPVYEDIAIVVDEAVTAQQLDRAIRTAGGRLLRDVRLFDVYRGAPVPAGQKSMAYALTYQSDSKTLQDAEVAKQRQRIVQHLERELGAVLRA